MRLRVMSDTHLEIADYDIPACGRVDVMVLAGDVGDPKRDSYARFLEKAASMCERLVVVKGNHECYRSSIAATDALIRGICSRLPNAHYLDRDSLDLSDTVRVVGATLWSHIDDEQRSDVGCFIADFRLIQGWSPEENNAQHAIDVRFLEQEVERATRDGKQLIVVTHHAPCNHGTSRPEHAGSPLSSAFSTDLSRIINAPIHTWVYGHTHHSARQFVNGVRLVSNQRGYATGSGKLTEPTGFADCCLVDVDV
jgi:predicted phosphodiesterase